MMRAVAGKNAQLDFPVPGRSATRRKVSPRPMKKTPPVLRIPNASERTETQPSVINTPPGMIAHQRSRLVR